MKKNINMYALLLALGISFAGITFAPEEPIIGESGHEQSGTETSEQRIERQKEEKEELAAKQKAEKEALNEHLNNVKKDITGNKETTKANKGIKDITGQDIKLDPKSKDLNRQKKAAKDALADKHTSETKALEDQHNAENDLNEDFGNEFSDNGLSDDGSTLLSQTEEIHNKLQELKASLEAIKNGSSESAFADRNSAVRELEHLTGISIVGKDGIFKNFSDLNLDNLDKIDQKIADIDKSDEEHAAMPEDAKSQEVKVTSEEIRNNELILYSVTSIADDLKSFDILTDEEISNLDEKLANVKQALADRIFSKIKGSMNELINTLRKFLAKILLNVDKLGSTLGEKINKLRNSFAEFIKNLNSESQNEYYYEPETSVEELKENALNDLGLSGDPSFDDIKKAYKKAALKYYPDKSMGLSQEIRDQNEIQFKKNQNAYDNLKFIYGQ